MVHRNALKIETKLLRKALTDESPAVRIEAANTLAHHGDSARAVQALIGTSRTKTSSSSPTPRALSSFSARPPVPPTPMAAALKRAETIRPPDTPATVVLPGDKDLAMFVAFSCRAFWRVGRVIFETL